MGRRSFMPIHKVYFGIAVSIAVIGLLSLCVWSPWHQVQPGGHGAVPMPYAPIWSHSDLPGASVNVRQWLLEAALILVIAGMIVKIGQSTRGSYWRSSR
jgi:hypothetical protein